MRSNLDAVHCYSRRLLEVFDWYTVARYATLIRRPCFALKVLEGWRLLFQISPAMRAPAAVHRMPAIAWPCELIVCALD
jgi:hypothetical protein